MPDGGGFSRHATQGVCALPLSSLEPIRAADAFRAEQRVRSIDTRFGSVPVRTRIDRPAVLTTWSGARPAGGCGPREAISRAKASRIHAWRAGNLQFRPLSRLPSPS